MSVLTDHCICALQEAIAAACIAAINSCSPQDLWSHVLRIVNAVIQAHDRHKKLRQTFMSRLPNEVLVEIFTYLSLWDRVRATTVCHRWRAVSLDAAAALWDHIPRLNDLDAYCALLARARDLPVTLEYAPKDLSNIRPFCALLSDNMYRVRALVLGLPESNSDEEQLVAASRLIDALDRPAPFLESLCISDDRGILLESYPALSILQNPTLRDLELGTFHLSRLKACAGSSALRTLKISTPYVFRDDALRLDDWCLIASFPALERLALHLSSVNNMSVLARCPPLPRSLQYLHVEMAGECLVQLVAVDDLTRFKALDICFYRHPPDLRRLAALMPFVPAETVSASVRIHAETYSLQATDGRGRSWFIENLEFVADWPTLFPNATCLWLDSYSKYAAQRAAALPAIEELTLDATVPLMFSATPSWPVLECPRLRAVRLGSVYPGALSVDAVLGHVRRMIGERRRLETLVLEDLALCAEPDLEALKLVAEHVSLERSDPAWWASHHCWPKWGRMTEF